MERHPTDYVSLVFGLLFALTGVAFLVSDAPFVEAADLRWFAPLLVLLLGLWLLASTALPRRRGVASAPDTDV